MPGTAGTCQKVTARVSDNTDTTLTDASDVMKDADSPLNLLIS